MKHSIKGWCIPVLCLSALLLPRSSSAQGQGYYDLFSVSLTPNGLYWNIANGGGGSQSDPLVPNLSGAPIVTTSPQLGGVVYAFGGLDWGTHTLESTISGGNSIQLTGAASYFLNITLDTATSPNNDTGYPSWGMVSNIQVQASDGAGGWLAPISVTFVKSPTDPNTIGQIMPNSSTVLLAPSSFNDVETGTETSAIYGVGAQLPSALGYRVTFDSALYTWDSYVPVPEPSVFAFVALIAVSRFSTRARTKRKVEV